MQTHAKTNRKMTFFIEYSGTKKSKSCCHSPFHPPNFCRHSLKLLSPTLPKLMKSPPPLSSDPTAPKIWNVHKLFRTPRNCKFQNFAAGAFHSHISYLWREIAKNLNYSSENRGFLYLKSPRMTFTEQNMDEAFTIVHRFNENPYQDFFRLTSCIVSCKFFMIKNSNNLTIKPGVNLSSMQCQ